MHNYDRLKQEIRNLKESLEEYRKMNISGLKAQVITDMPICRSGESKTESMAITRVDYIKSLEDEIDSKMRIVRAIESVYFYLHEPHRSIIEMRYFIMPNPQDIRQRKYNWIEIAAEVNYSEDWCKEIDCKIILQIMNKLHEITHILPTHLGKVI